MFGVFLMHFSCSLIGAMGYSTSHPSLPLRKAGEGFANEKLIIAAARS